MKSRRICIRCRKEFFIVPSKARRGKGKFCSKRCYAEWQLGRKSNRWRKIKRQCLICKKIFSAKPFQVKKGNARFCSKECFGKWLSVNIRGEKSHRWKGGKIKRECKTCGKEIFVKSHRVKDYKNSFCSRKCNGIWQVKHAKKENTSIELAIEAELIRQKIPYMKQAPVGGIALVDFLLPNKVIIQCDGDYWHSLKEVKDRDRKQDYILGSEGYTVYRFSGSEIRKSARECIDRVCNSETFRRKT